MKQMESGKQTKNEKQTKGEKRMEDEKQAARKRRDKRYNDYVKQVTPKHNCLLNMLKAFVSERLHLRHRADVFGLVRQYGLMKDEVSGYTTLSLILISVILTLSETGWGPSQNLPVRAIWCRLQALPIRWHMCTWNLKLKEKFLVWAARYLPLQATVILYGIVTSWVLGAIYWVVQMFALG